MGVGRKVNVGYTVNVGKGVAVIVYGVGSGRFVGLG